MAIKDGDDGMAADPVTSMAVIGPIAKAIHNLIAGLCSFVQGHTHIYCLGGTHISAVSLRHFVVVF